MISTATSSTSADPTEIEGHRTYLLRYASLQLRDAGAAEDAVQDTLIAGLEGLDRFSGKSSVKTWLTGILKHKIIDHMRRQAREQPLISGDADSDRSEASAPQRHGDYFFTIGQSPWSMGRNASSAGTVARNLYKSHGPFDSDGFFTSKRYIG